MITPEPARQRFILFQFPVGEEKPPFPFASVRGYYSESAVRKLAFDGHLASISGTPKGWDSYMNFDTDLKLGALGSLP